MRRALMILVLAAGMMGAAPAHSSSEAPDTQPVTPEHLMMRGRIYTALRIGGALTAAGLLSLIVILARRDWKRGGCDMRHALWSMSWLPPQAAQRAVSVDHLFEFLLAVSAFFAVLIAAAILYFVLRYRRRAPGAIGADVPSSTTVEIIWTVIPLLISMVMFVWGAKLYMNEAAPPANAIEIIVVGKQWMWKIQQPSGRREIDELHVPVGRPVTLMMTSQDVIHSFFIPAFRMKHDVVPGRYCYEWFTATKVGEYHLFCSQYCGTQHSKMVGKVIVMEPGDYARWLEGTGDEISPAKEGWKLFQNYGCNNCHGQQGPTLAGLYGSAVKLDDGRTVTADDSYLRESILDSQAKVVAGFGHIMPSYQGQLSEEQVSDLVAYIRSLKAADRAADAHPVTGAKNAATAPGSPRSDNGQK